jgi:DNA-binding transcriptional regulator YhcF (GntR family)
MAVNVEVEKNHAESTANLVRRFTKRMQGAGIVQKIRGTRYFKRDKSENVHRRSKLLRLERQKNYETLLKLGKIQDPRQR